MKVNKALFLTKNFYQVNFQGQNNNATIKKQIGQAADQGSSQNLSYTSQILGTLQYNSKISFTSAIAPASKVDFSSVSPSERKWWKETIVYQVYPQSFKDTDGNGIGDIKGITQKLDYLQNLGVDTLWLNPVYFSPEADNGYDISDYKKINPKYGTMEDMEELLKKVHDKKMHLIMDLVVNHTSDEHEWFKAASDPSHPDHKKYKDYYIWADPKNPTPENPKGEVPNRWESHFKGSAWAYNEKMGKYYFHLFHQKQPDLNWKNPHVRKDVKDITQFWLEKGIDGFRMDVIDLIGMKKPDLNPKTKPLFGIIQHPIFEEIVARMKDTSLPLYKLAPLFIDHPRLDGYLKELMRKNDKFHPYNPENEIMTVGESPLTPLRRLQHVVGEDKLSMIFNFDLVTLDCENNTQWSTKKPSLADMRKVITKWQKGAEEKGLWNSIFDGNHDQPRAVSRFGNDSTEEFRKSSAKMLATLDLTLRGTPYIFMGEEIGMTNAKFDNIKDYRDVETDNIYKETVKNAKINAQKEAKTHNLSEAQTKTLIQKSVLKAEKEIMEKIKAKSRDNSRTPMQWDSSEKAGFTTGTPWININKNHSPNIKYSPINVEDEKKDSGSILNYYKKMIQVRKENPALVYGKFDILAPKNKQILAYTRTLGNQKALVVLNYSAEPAKFLTKANHINMADSKLLINNNPEMPEDKMENMSLKPYEARVYLLKTT
ncbi:MAG: alpha-glucosidase [Candidatus Gastranaerophilaceae bacterium]